MDVHDVSAAYIRAFLLYHFYFVTCISVRVFKIHIYIYLNSGVCDLSVNAVSSVYLSVIWGFKEGLSTVVLKV